MGRFRAQCRTSIPTSSFVVNQCSVKQNSNQFDFINSGCLYSPLQTTRYTSWLSNVSQAQQFSFNSFLFSSSDPVGLTLTCSISICYESCSAAPEQASCDTLPLSNYLA